MKNKGQALVEFILLLPIIIFIILSLSDLTNITIKKYELENDLDIISELYNNNRLDKIENITNNKKIVITYETKGDFTTIILTKSIAIMTPGLNNILKSPITIKVEKVVYE